MVIMLGLWLHNIKVEFSWCLTKCYAMYVYWGIGYIAPRNLNLSIRWMLVSLSCPSCSTVRVGTTDTHWTGGWVGPRASVDILVRRKIPSPCQELNPGCLAHSLVPILTLGYITGYFLNRILHNEELIRTLAGTASLHVTLCKQYWSTPLHCYCHGTVFCLGHRTEQGPMY